MSISKHFKLLAFIFFLTTSTVSAPTHQVDVHVAKLSCSQVSEENIRTVLREASLLLASRCNLRIRYRGFEEIKTKLPWCQLPANRKKRIKAVQDFSLPYRQGRRSHEVSIFLVAETDDLRMAWALFDSRQDTSCGDPKNPNHLPYLGSVFLSNDAFRVAEASDQYEESFSTQEHQTPSLASRLLTHELVHALTQKGHPSGQKPGNILADAIGDIGSTITGEQCRCMLQSPWVHPIP